MLHHNIVPQKPTITVQQCKICVVKRLKRSDFEIIEFKLISLAEKSGFLGEHFHLKITIYINGTLNDVHCFAKYLPETQAQIDFAVGCGAIKKEVFVYEELFPRIHKVIDSNILQSCHAECYYTKPNYVLVFEDVTKNGYKPLPRYGHLDYDHIIVILKQLARLHASSLIFEEKLSNNYRIIDEYADNFFETFYIDEPDHKGGQGLYAAILGLETGIKIFPEDKSKLSNTELQSRIAKASANIFELVKPSKKYRNVICHGDLWCTNIMMVYSNGKPIDCKFIDFQTARYCPPAHDFMSFLCLTMSRELRMQHFEYLQQLYYKELTMLVAKHNYDLKSLISFEEFVDSCHEQKCFAVVQTATYCQLTQVKTEFITEFLKDIEKWNYALYTDRSIMVSESCANDPEYKRVLRDTLKDLRDLCEEME